MAIFLETQRLIIRTPELTDMDNLYALQTDPEVMRYIGNGVRSHEEVKLSLERSIQHQEKHGFSLGSVYEKETGAFVGRAGLIYLGLDDTQPDIEVAYGLMKAAWNKGYATELAQALIDWGFKHLNINKLVAVINPKNTGSRHVLEKVNMHYVGPAYYHNIHVDFFQIDKRV